MADLNGGKGKFFGVDSNVQYVNTFKGATKVAEKVKKGGTEDKPDGYVVDAIDIDWGGLKLTAIADNWSYGLQTESSTEQNAGKGENTKGIHSTAYLLNKIGSSFTQIYNQIGGSDNAGLRNRVKVVEDAIHTMANLSPTELNSIRNSIQKIEEELKNPGAANTLVTILDALDGFSKTKGDVKDYIDKHDAALLGTATDSATTYSVYGVRKYVDTTAKEHLIGKPTDVATADTIWGAKNYANTTVKNSLLGASGDTWPTKQTLYGVVKYSDTKNADLKTILIGKPTDAATADTIWGAKSYAKEQISETKYNQLTAQVIEENGEGILELLTVSSYLG